jgi:catalase
VGLRLGSVGAASGEAVEADSTAKTLLVIGGATALLEKAGISARAPDPGLILSEAKCDPAPFLAALAKHRHAQRDQDPPSI